MEVFEFKAGEETIKLEWGIWAMHRFCELMGTKNEDGTIKPITPGDYMKMMDPNESGVVQFSLIQIVRMIQAAADSYNEGMNPTERQVGRWVDASGGIGVGSEASRFLAFMIGEIKTDTTDPVIEEKKREE